MQSTVHPEVYKAAVRHRRPREIIAYLQRRFKPSDSSNFNRLQEKFIRLSTGPMNQDLDQFNNDFAEMVEEANDAQGYQFTPKRWAQIYVESLRLAIPVLYQLLSPQVESRNDIDFMKMLQLCEKYWRNMQATKSLV
jgi:hypothetical protein